MKNRRFSWQNRSAKFRAIFNTVCILLCILTLYFLADSPPFSVKDAFRRAEKANFVGPSKITAHVEFEDLPYSHMILAEEENAVTLFTYKKGNDAVTELIYTEKDNAMALVAGPQTEDLAIAKSANVPLILFHSNPYAVRAEMELTLTGVYRDESYTFVYPLSAQHEHENLFIFYININQATPLLEAGYLLNMLQMVHSSPRPALAGVTITADVTLYNGKDAVIESRELILCGQ